MALVFQNATGLKIGFWKYLRAGKDISNQTPQRFKKLRKTQCADSNKGAYRTPSTMV